MASEYALLIGFSVVDTGLSLTTMKRRFKRLIAEDPTIADPARGHHPAIHHKNVRPDGGIDCVYTVCTYRDNQWVRNQTISQMSRPGSRQRNNRGVLRHNGRSGTSATRNLATKGTPGHSTQAKVNYHDSDKSPTGPCAAG